MIAPLKITATPTPGTSIEALAADSQRIADTLGAAVEFRFNCMRCVAWPGGSAETLIKNVNAGFQRQQSEGVCEQIATS